MLFQRQTWHLPKLRAMFDVISEANMAPRQAARHVRSIFNINMTDVYIEFHSSLFQVYFVFYFQGKCNIIELMFISNVRF